MSKIIAGIIEKYLGEFVVLDKEKFDVSLFTETRIQNVAIRPDLLSQFVDSPIYGHVECISINPNVGKTKPLEIKISGIYIALVLTNGDTSKSIDPVEAKRRRLAANDIAMQQNYKDELALSKMSAAELHERALKQQQGTGDQGGARKDTNEVSIGEKFARKLLKRMFLLVENLHVRVETDGACFGIIMKSLILETNKELKPTDYQSPRNTFIINGLGIYIDRPNGPGESCPAKQEEFVRYLLGGITAPHDYILKPYTMGFSLSWALKTMTSMPLPPARYALSGTMADISIVLSKEQYDRLFVALDSLKHQCPLPDSVKKKRPTCSVKENPREWFRYAGEAVMFQVADKRMRRSTKFLSERFATKRKYCALYQKKLTKKIRIEESKELERMDMALDINDIMFFRSFAVAEMSVSFNEKMKGIRSSHNKLGQPLNALSSSNGSTGSLSGNFRRSFSFLSTDDKKALPMSSGSGGSSSGLKPFGGLRKFSLLKEINMGGDDDEDDDFAPENLKSQSMFAMNVGLRSFNIVLQNGSSSEGTPLLTLKVDTIRANLSIPTQLTTNVNIKLYNLIGTYRDPVTGEHSTLLTYVPDPQQSHSQSPTPSLTPPPVPQPFVNVALNKRDDYLGVKATVRPLEIVLTERIAEHLAHFMLPPEDVNVMDLGTQFMSFIYMYVLLVDDALSDNNIKPGPGKALEKVGIDATVKELTIRVKSADNSNELDIGIGQINAKSDACEARTSIDQHRTSIDQHKLSVEKSKNAAGITVSVAGIYVGVPRRDETTASFMHIIPPFDVGAELSLPLYSKKTGGDPIAVRASVEALDVVLSEEAICALLELEKHFSSILMPILCKYLSSLAENIGFSGKLPNKKNANGSNVGSGAVSAAAAAVELSNTIPININATVQVVLVSWLGKKHDESAQPIVAIDVSEIGFAGNVTKDYIQGDFGIPKVRICDGRARTQLEVSEIIGSLFAPESGTARIKCSITAVESRLETLWLAETVGSLMEISVKAAHVLYEDIVSVILQYKESISILIARMYRPFLVEASIPGIRLVVLNGQSAIAIEVAGVTATIESPFFGLATTLSTVGGVRICSGTIPAEGTTITLENPEEGDNNAAINTDAMLDLVRVGKGKDLPKELVLSQGDTVKRPSVERQKAAVRLDVCLGSEGCKVTGRVNDVFVSTQDIVNVLGLGIRAGKELIAAIPETPCKKVAEALKSLVFNPNTTLEVPAISIDFGVQDIAVDLVPPYAPEEKYKVRVAKVAFGNTPENVCGAARIEGVEMWGRDAPMFADPLTITAEPKIRIDKAAKEIIVGMNVAITPVKLVLVAEHVQGLAFLLAAGTILLLAAPLWESDVFPSFLRVELDSGIRIPHVGIAFRTSPLLSSGTDVLNVLIDDLAITGNMSCHGQTFAIAASTLVVAPACENGGSDTSGGAITPTKEEPNSAAMCLRVGRKKTDDAVTFTADVDVGGLVMEAFDNHTIFSGFLPLAKRIIELGINFKAFRPPGLGKRGKRAVVLDARVSLGNGLTLRYGDYVIIRVAPIAVALGARANGAVESLTFKTNIDDGVLITDKYGNAIVTVSKVAVNVDSCLDVTVSNVKVAFWPGIISNIVLPIICDMNRHILAAAKREDEEEEEEAMQKQIAAAAAGEERTNDSEKALVVSGTEAGTGGGLRVPSFLDKYTVNVAVEDIVVDVRRAVKAEDGRVVAVISALRVRPPCALERGKPLIPSIFTDTRLDIDKIYTVCGGFTQGLADNMHISFCITPDNDLVFRTIQLTLGFGRNHLAAFYSLVLAFTQVKIPPLSVIIPPELLDRVFRPKKRQASTAVAPRKKDLCIKCELPEITLAWVDCFTCTISGIEFGFVGTLTSQDISINVRSMVIADNHVDKMAAHPILSLLEEADGSPAVGVRIRISEEDVAPVPAGGEDGAVATVPATPRKRRVINPTIRMSVISVFATPEIIDTTVGDIKWMQNYNIRVFDDETEGGREEEPSAEEKEAKAEQDSAMKKKIADAISNFELRVVFEFVIGGISAHFYEDYTALYCIGAFGMSLDRFTVAVVTPSVKRAEGQKIDIEEFDIEVRDMRVAAGFRCSSGGEEEGGPRAVSLYCPHVKVWITDGVLSSLTIGMSALNIDVQAELLTSFVEHATRIKLNVSITRAKNVVRHADMRHAPWDIDSASINEVEKMDARPPGVLDMVAAMKSVLDKGMSAKVTFGDINITARTLTGYSLVLNIAGFECILDDIELRRIQLIFSAQVLEHELRTQLFFPWKIIVSVLNNMDTPSVQVQMVNTLMFEVNPQGLKGLCFVLDAIRKGFPDDYEPVFNNTFDIPVYSPPPPSASANDLDTEDYEPKEVERSLALESVFEEEVLDIKGTVTSRPAVGSDLHKVDIANWGTRTWEGRIPPGVCGLSVRNEATGKSLCLILKGRMSPSGEAGAIVESLLNVYNKTDFELSLIFATDSRMELRPRSRAHAPPHFIANAENASFCVEAVNTRTLSKHRVHETKKHRSTPVTMRRSAGKRYLEELRVERPDSAEGKRRWFYLTLVYDVSPQKIASIDTGSKETFFASRAMFFPTLYIENALPTHATVELTDTSTHETARVSIDSGSTTSILDIQRKETINIMATITVSTHPSAPVVVGAIKVTLKYPSPKADPTEQLRPASRDNAEVVVDVTFNKMPEYNGIICAGLSQDEGSGIWKVRLFSRYILMNTTGLNLEVKNGTLLPLENTSNSVFLVNFRPAKGLCLRKVGTKEWSSVIDVEYGHNGTVDIPGAGCTAALKVDPNRESFGVSLRMYLGPMFTVYNELGFAVSIRQPLSTVKERHANRTLENQERADIFCTIEDGSKDRFITIKADGHAESEPIDVSAYTENKTDTLRIRSVKEKGSFKIIHIVNNIIFHFYCY